jgi:hypothetical protein
MQINEVKNVLDITIQSQFCFSIDKMYIIIIFLHVCYFTLKNKRFCHSTLIY